MAVLPGFLFSMLKKELQGKMLLRYITVDGLSYVRQISIVCIAQFLPFRHAL